MPALNTIKIRRGTASAWTSANPTLAAGEMGYETDTVKLKIGDGSTAWNSLAYTFSNGAAPADGWIDDSAETWTYASGSGGGTATFTVPGDKTAKYTVGTRIKLTQTTVKYFVVSANPVFASGNTTVTITAGSDYTLANAAISANYHSYLSNPQGYPSWFNYDSYNSGWSGPPTPSQNRFFVVGRLCVFNVIINGTSNSSSASIKLPIPAPQFSDYSIRVKDNGVTLTTPGMLEIGGSGATTGSVYTDLGGNGWTASGTKQIIICGCSYEI